MNFKSLSICALAAMAMIACAPQTQETEEVRIENVETTSLKKTTISRILELPATLQGYETVNIAPSLQGKIEHIYTEVGTNVKTGDLLVRMDQNQYNTVKMNYSNTEIEMSRMEALHESGSVSQQAYDQAKLGFDQLKQNLDFITANTFVRAPFAGVISAKNYEDGELFAGQPIVVLTQINKLKTTVSIPERYYPTIKAGMAIDIKSDIYPEETFKGSIEVVYPTIDAASHTFRVKIVIPNASLKLRPGMYAETTLQIGQDEAMVVPFQSVQKMVGSNDRFVFVNDGGVAKRVFVTMGQRFDDMIEIISDELIEGSNVVTLGQAKLVDGAKMNVVKEN